jgi:hypothetical protein
VIDSLTQTDIGSRWNPFQSLSSRANRGLLLGLIAVTSFLALGAPPASAEVKLCSSVGTGAAQCSKPQGVATDFETARVYVADRNNNRVDVFEANGNFLEAFGWGVDTGAAELQTCTTASGCQAGIAGSGAGQFSSPTRIAVDNVSGSASRHDVYVGTDNFRVQKFSPTGALLGSLGSQGAGKCQISQENGPIAVGPGGNVFVSDGSGTEPNFTDRVEKFSPTGSCLGETVLVKGNHRQIALSVDSSEDAYVSDERGNGLRRYDLSSPETQLCALDPGTESDALALDDAGHLFAFQRESRVTPLKNAFHVIAEYDSSCNIIRRFGYGNFHSSLEGLAFLHSSEGDLFGSEENGGLIPYLAIPSSAGPIIAPESLEVSPIGNASATIHAEINPEGKETKYKVEYVDQHSFETEAGFNSPHTRSSGEVALGASDFRVHLAELVAGCKPFGAQALGEGRCLKPETPYRYRVVAKSAEGEENFESSFTSGPALEFETYATEVGTDTATLNAALNPLGVPATGYFEYVSDAQFKANGFAEATKVPNPETQAELDFGSGEVAVKHSIVLFPLPSDATYHYRVVATDPLLEAAVLGEDKTFRTLQGAGGSEACLANEAFRVGPAALLPDCRAYEMVSPLDKEGSDLILGTQSPTGRPAAVQQSSVSGEKLTYGASRAFGDAKSSPLTSQYIATRHPAGSPEEGWQGHGITPAGEGSIKGRPEFDYEFEAFSPDLCEGWITPFSEPILAPEATPGRFNLYHAQFCGGESYETLTTTEPPNANTKFFQLELQGLSSDGALALFAADDNLSPDSPSQPAGCVNKSEGCQRRLYAKVAGFPPRFLCILPNGEASKAPCSAGTGSTENFGRSREANVKGALSADGTKIFWSASENDGKIYLRENPFGEGVECAEASAPCTLAVSKTAEEETASSASHFWAAAADGSRAIFSSGGSLYEFEAASKATQKIAGGVLGVLGTSEDATRVYFAAAEKIPGSGENSEGEEAIPGRPNLYLHEAGGGDRFIATLAAADVKSSLHPRESSATAPEPLFHNGRVSADGLTAAFMSAAPLTGYDNTDATSPEECGKAKGICDTEVFVYRAAANEGEGRLLCVSCNPSGARPEGVNIAGEGGAPIWEAARIQVLQNTLYEGRVLADNGSRLYFESQDPLVARDTNGRLDVYQWEAPGTGGCTEERPTFVADAGGCVDLISSGQSTRDSEFIDASPDGRDVFFNTLSSLAPQDPGLVDIYDARAGGGFPAPPAPPASCEGEACQGPASPPNDPTPASSSFEGAGNAVQPAAAKKHKKKKKHSKKHAKKQKRSHANRRAAR